MKLKPYPKYKDSGIQWIGKIPEGWEIHRLKFLLSSLESGSRETGGGSQLDEGVFSLGGEHINWNGTLNLENPKLISEKYYNTMNQGKLKTNDVLLVKDGATIGKTAILKQMDYEKMAVNEHVFLMRPNRRIKPKLLYYLICGDSGFRQIKLTETGSAQGGVNQDFKGVVSFTISPEMKEQDILINFLDKKTAKIDALIEKDKRLIELLKEKRTALINHAVTKGLDPNVKLKDSGIDWIGEIPEGWEVRRLRFNALVNPSGKKALSNPKTLVNFLPMEKVSESGEYEQESKAEYQDVSTGYTYFEDNDVLVAKITPCFENGKGALVNNLKFGFGFGTTEFHVIRSYSHLMPKYLFYLTKTHLFRVTGEAFMEGAAGQKRVSTDFIKDFMMTTPPLPDQTAIANFLDKATAKIDKIIKLIEKKIKLLEEYKKSLIHHVVTGRVDVRGVEA
jgi:Restriction endonuclease S subunits